MDAADHLQRAFELLGIVREDDPETRDTARRFAELMAGFAPEPLPALTPVATRSREPLVVRDLAFHSLCAHHLLPFFGTVDIAILPRDRIAGLGSYHRLVEALARRPQLQERLTEAIATALQDALDPAALAVRLRARHLCVEMRGHPAAGTIESWCRRGAGADDLDRLLRARP